MAKEFSCGGKTFSNKKVLLIAELGTAHNASFIKAKQLIDAAQDAGADAVKFQIVYADEILHPKTGTVKLPSGIIPLYESFKRLEVDFAFFEKLAEYCEQKSLMFSASSFGRRSTEELFRLNPCFIKVASPELNYIQLLEQISQKNFPVILSSGISTLSDIELSIETLKKNLKADVALLHCITSYPAPAEEYNLSLLKNLSNIFGIALGVSDHSKDKYLVPLLSMTCGSCIVEKHFCLSNKDSGLDDKIALNAKDFYDMAKAIRDCEKFSSDKIIEKLLNLGFDKNKIKRTLGSGKKVLAKSEKENYGRTNRSIHYMNDLKAGHILTEKDLAILRTEKILSVGEHPKMLEYFLGAVLQKDVKAGSGARLFDIIKRENYER